MSTSLNTSSQAACKWYIVVHGDCEREGVGHDKARDDVADRVSTLAANKLCVAVVASPPCLT
eukprot:2579264-Pleurochrysis_carterae.AAC.1